MTQPSSNEHPRLAVVLSHPTQYYSPWFRWLAQHTTLSFRVFYLWDFGVRPQRDPRFESSFSWDTDLLSGYDSEFIPNTAGQPGTDRFFGLRNPQLVSRIKEWKPHAILCFGYAYASLLEMIAWARTHGIPLVFRGDSHFIDRRPPKKIVGMALRSLFRQFSAFTYVGQANLAYFRQLGVPEEKLFFAPHAVDSTQFDPNNPTSQKESNELRKSLGIPAEHRVILFAGKFHREKQPLALLDAFLSLKVNSATLVFVGGGEQREALVERAQNASNVKILTFANQSEMPSRYLMADIFALPSIGHYETWGLAVNEAMHMGKPCLVSDRVGCQQDLVSHGETGWVFRATDNDAMKNVLREALDADLAPFRERVLQRVKRYSYANAAQGLQDALIHAMNPSR